MDKRSSKVMGQSQINSKVFNKIQIRAKLTISSE